MPGSKISVHGFKNRDTPREEYLLGFEVIAPVFCVSFYAASAPHSVGFAMGGKANLSV